jgi:acyl-CoA thioester hydrolase
MPAESRIRAPLRWRDMDMLGHLNQSVFHELLEEGRAALFRSLGGGEPFPFVLARVELDYRHEVRHTDGHVDVAVRVGAVGRTSVTLEHAVLLPDGTVAAEGRSVLVAWDADARRPRGLSARERAVLE